MFLPSERVQGNGCVCPDSKIVRQVSQSQILECYSSCNWAWFSLRPAEAVHADFLSFHPVLTEDKVFWLSDFLWSWRMTIIYFFLVSWNGTEFRPSARRAINSGGSLTKRNKTGVPENLRRCTKFLPRMGTTFTTTEDTSFVGTQRTLKKKKGIYWEVNQVSVNVK